MVTNGFSAEVSIDVSEAGLRLVAGLRIFSAAPDRISVEVADLEELLRICFMRIKWFLFSGLQGLRLSLI